MAIRAKYKVGEEVLFRFAGSSVIGEVVDVVKQTSNIKYKIVSDEGTLYPVDQNNIDKKL